MAETTVSGDQALTTDRVLSEDTTVEGNVILSPGVKVDLNGHTLTAHGVKENPNDSYASSSADLTSPSGTITGRGNLSSGSGATLFNNNKTYSSTNRILMWGVSTNKPFWVTYDFGEGQRRTITKYRIYSRTDGFTDRWPNSWKLEGSNDNATWATVDSRSGETWSSGTTHWERECATPGAYRYYRFYCMTVKSGEYLEMHQLEYFGSTPEPAVRNPGPREDVTEPTGSLISNGSTDEVRSLFDNNMTYGNAKGTSSYHRMIFNTKDNPFYVTYDFGEGAQRKITRYKLYFGCKSGYEGRGPKNWVLEGSNTGNDGDWTEVDSQSDIKWTNYNFNGKEYTCATPGAYRYYRWKCTATTGVSADNDNRYLELAQIEYFCNVAGTGGAVIDTPDEATVANTKVNIGANAATFEKTGEGTFSSSKALLHGGATTVSGGTLALGVNNMIPSSSAVTVGAGGTLDLGAKSQTIASLAGAGTVRNGTLTVSDAINPGTDALTPATLTLGDLALSGKLVLDASASGLDSISVVSGAFALGNLDLQINNDGTLPRGRYDVVSSIDGFSGEFKSTTGISGKWSRKWTDTLFSICTKAGFLFFVK